MATRSLRAKSAPRRAAHQTRIRIAHAGYGCHRGMASHCHFHLFAIYFLAAPIHQVLQSSTKYVVGLAVNDLLSHQIAGQVEAILGKRLPISVLCLIVAAYGIGPLERRLADFAAPYHPISAGHEYFDPIPRADWPPIR